MSYQEFAASLNTINLFNPQYDSKLTRLYTTYQECEKDREYERTKTLLEHIGKKTMNSVEETTRSVSVAGSERCAGR